MKWIGLLAALLLPAVAAAAATPAPASRLDALLAQTKTLTADFAETVVNANAVTVKRSSGTLAIAKPGRFRWDYKEPYRQLILADGEKLWTWDPALEQVVVRDQPHALASGPAALLAGTASVEKRFEVRRIQRAGTLDWLQLTPKSADSSFKEIRIGLDDEGRIRSLELDSRLGQTTRIEFSHIRRNAEIAPGLFRFTPPANADVVHQGV
ncbi:MAG: outer membrane lipoprotein chaperone LolA [Gammaproteobacteria bacterium]|nr:outer membrane lipoprotein chaperone LolA [Gammaproteobacteria bacterium]